MTPRQLIEFRKRLGLTQKAFAKHIGVAPNTVARWERGEIGMRPSTERLLQLLVQQTDLTTPAIAVPAKDDE
jgi:transcriptional regulator with XRE-family HTH domain